MRIASTRNVCDSEHSYGQFHCTGWFIPGKFPPILFSFIISFYSSNISNLHLMYVLYPFASRAHQGQTRIYSYFLIATFISTLSSTSRYSFYKLPQIIISLSRHLSFPGLLTQCQHGLALALWIDTRGDEGIHEGSLRMRCHAEKKHATGEKRKQKKYFL